MTDKRPEMLGEFITLCWVILRCCVAGKSIEEVVDFARRLFARFVGDKVQFLVVFAVWVCEVELREGVCAFGSIGERLHRQHSHLCGNLLLGEVERCVCFSWIWVEEVGVWVSAISNEVLHIGTCLEVSLSVVDILPFVSYSWTILGQFHAREVNVKLALIVGLVIIGRRVNDIRKVIRLCELLDSERDGVAMLVVDVLYGSVK
mgnify:CR=1 FL=1